MDVTLRADARKEIGTAPSRRLRARGLVPAVLYGAGIDGAVAVAVGRRELLAALSTEAGRNAVITLDVDGAEHITLAREIQRHPVRNEVLHVDFVAIRRDQEVQSDVPVVLVGEAPATADDLVVTQQLTTVSVTSLPADIPDQIAVDVSGLASPGDTIRVGDLAPPRGVTVVTDADEPVVAVAAGEVVEEAIEEAAETARAEEAAAAGEPAPGASQ